MAEMKTRRTESSPTREVGPELIDQGSDPRTRQVLAELDREISDSGSAAGLEDLFTDLSRVCHKINNPLTSLLGRAQMLAMKLQRGDAEQTEKMVEVIQESSQRVASYIQEMARIVNRGREELLPPREPGQDSAG
jgi:signal transduction histidine kinase